jgi:hypothetical protein
MKIDIDDLVAARLRARVIKIRSIFGGKDDVTIEDLANKYLTRYLNKIDDKERKAGSNTLEWAGFKRKNLNEIWNRDQRKCTYCLIPLSKSKATIDHKTPPLRGGVNSLENTCLSCEWCNVDKGFLTQEEYFYKQLVNASKNIKSTQV